METIGTYEGDTVAHISLPFSARTVCGIYVAYTESGKAPAASLYATPCGVCMEAVDRLEDFMLGIVE